MDRKIVGAMIALVALGSLTSCTNEAKSTNTPVVDTTSLSPGRFQETAAKLETFASFLFDKKTPKLGDSVQADRSGAENAAAANKILGLDENSPARFAIMVSKEYKMPDGSTRPPLGTHLSHHLVCDEFDNNTYYAVSYDFYFPGEVDINMLLGDGPCSVEEKDAVVVGVINGKGPDGTDAWTKGAELMGDFTPNDLLNSREVSN